MISLSKVERYLKAYIREYRSQYNQMTSSEGGGYPKLPLSPYLYEGKISCYLATDGAVILDSTPPSPDWVTLGGVARMCIFPSSDIPDDIWQGTLAQPSWHYKVVIEDIEVEISQYAKYTRVELLSRLTYGFFLRVPLPSQLPPDSLFWLPIIIREIGFFPGRPPGRYFRYCEVLRHIVDAAWDERSAWARVSHDLRRHFLQAADGGPAGRISFSNGPGLPFDPTDRSQMLSQAADGLERLLNSDSSLPESVFHEFIKAHPVLLDIYGNVDSKPRWRYPESGGPFGKSYTEPDFIIRYWNQTYKLVELEKPGHNFATRSEHPAVSVTHAAYQIAEWRYYIDNYYDRIKDAFPGITSRHPGMLIISRDSQRSFANTPKEQYLAIVRGQLNVEEIYTYDDLVHRAREVVRGLRSLTIGL